MTSEVQQIFRLEKDACRIQNPELVEEQFGRLLIPRMDLTTGSTSSVERKFESLLTVEKNAPRPAFAIGHYLAYKAEKLGIEIGLYPNSRSTEIQLARPNISNPYAAAADFISDHASGVIRYDDPLPMLDLATTLAMPLKNRVSYFLSSKRSQLRSFANRLGKLGAPFLLMEECGQISDDYFDDATGLKPVVVLSTFQELDSSHFTHADVVIFLNGSEILHQRASYMLTAQPDLRPRFFAFEKQSARLSPRESTAVAAMFGPNRLSIACDGNIGRPTNFAAADYADHKSRRESPDADSEARFFAYAATIAKGVLGSRVKDQQFPAVARWLRENEVVEPHTAIVASSPKTAIEIAKRLPTWALATHVEPNGPIIERLPKTYQETLVAGRRRLERRNGDGLITTAAAMNDAASTFCPDVVLSVSPSPEPPKLPDAWTYQTPGIPRPLLLVDIKDRRVTERKDLRMRDREYDRRDIFKVGIGEVEGRIRRFWNNQRRWRREAT